MKQNILSSIFAGAFLLAALPLSAQDAKETSEAAGETGPGKQHPQELVKSVSEKVLAALREADSEQERAALVNNQVRDVILPHLDFVAMSKLVLGKHWRRADQAQREAFVGEFKNLLIRTYSSSLVEYSNEKVAFLPFRESNQPEKLAMVRSEIRRANGPSIPINYSLRYKPEDGWKVYDIGIEGVSLVTNYRSSFSREINRHGIDHLIESLKQRNAAKAGGAAPAEEEVDAAGESGGDEAAGDEPGAGPSDG